MLLPTFLLMPFLYIGGLVQFVGVVFSPFAALGCARIAHRRGLGVWRYALAGGAYSIMLLLPWLYLVRGMEGKPVPSDFIKWAYYAVYALWIALLISQGLFLFTPQEGGDWPPLWDDSPITDQDRLFWSLWWILVAMIIASVTAFVVSLVTLRSRIAMAAKQPPDTQPDEIPHFVYIMPFSCVSVHLIMLAILTALVIVFILTQPLNFGR